jgi:regulator of sirC expression with transglutaminase-like and TPR domain
MTAQQAREGVCRILSAGSPSDLVEAALLLGIDEYPDLDPQPYLDQVEDLTCLVAERNGDCEDPVYRLASLRRVIFEDAGFHGSRENYYDPRNSYLHEVLDRRLGIPISLSLLVLGIGRRLGWPVDGVNFPLHFLVRYGDSTPLLAVDAYHGGLILSEDELRERWLSATGATPPPLEEMLAPASTAAILARLLNNLKVIYAHRQDFCRAALVAEKLVLVQPGEPTHHRALGYLYALDKRVEPAVSELHRYLRMSPAAADRNEVLKYIQEVSASGLSWD